MTQALFYGIQCAADLAHAIKWSRFNVGVMRAINSKAEGNNDKSIKNTLSR